MVRWIFSVESIFLPAFPVLQGRTDRSRKAGDGAATLVDHRHRSDDDGEFVTSTLSDDPADETVIASCR